MTEENRVKIKTLEEQESQIVQKLNQTLQKNTKLINELQEKSSAMRILVSPRNVKLPPSSNITLSSVFKS